MGVYNLYMSARFLGVYNVCFLVDRSVVPIGVLLSYRREYAHYVRLHLPCKDVTDFFGSVHYLLMECRLYAVVFIGNRRRTGISTHALLAECDYKPDTFYTLKDDFNSRTPCGVRLRGKSGISKD